MLYKWIIVILKGILKIKSKLHIVRTTRLSIEKSNLIIMSVYEEHDCYCSDVNLSEQSELDLSIVVPIYNASAYIERCVDSLINQKTNYKYEIILINDGSTDDTLTILEKYVEDYRVTLLNQTNQGISITRNNGIKIAKGKYIGFVDNDDAVSEDYVDKLLRKAFEINADMVKCGLKTTYGEGKNVIDIFESRDYAEGLGKDILKYDGFVWGGIYKRKLWENFKFPMNYWYEDMVTRLNLMARSRIFSYIGEPLYVKYYHNNNASKKVWNPQDYKCIDQLFLVKQLYKLTKIYNIDVNEEYLELILYELSVLLFSRTRNLKSKYQKSVFVLAAEFINSLDIFKIKYNDNNKLHKAFKKYDYIMWRDYSLYLKLEEKL